jgi:hypothetical protein
MPCFCTTGARISHCYVFHGLKQTKKYIRHTNIHYFFLTKSLFAGTLTLGFSLIQCTDRRVTFDKLAGMRSGLETALAIAFKKPLNRKRLEFNPLTTEI